ncbi:MAG TPA: dipicolinate synthase subunit DpsA [Syntrophomonadaceae bacterium]|nr:dipicolinate synthase subunit DpsA [Syntrophomonadaceae bacterium]
MLSGLKVAVLGGDARELILVAELVKMGATVVVAGFPRDMIGPGAFTAASVEEACKDAEAVIMPLPGTNPQGVIRAVYFEGQLVLSEKAIRGLAPHAVVIIGWAQPYLKQWSKQYGFVLVEVNDDDELAILNSIPSIEGALQIAMEETLITIHGSRSCIIGYGRVGISLARALKALGSDVVVVARNKGQLARAYEMGCQPAHFPELQGIINSCDMVFNTVPSMVLDRETLQYAHPDIVIIDLANQPGGTDFQAANDFGLKAILAPGLPGKVAPVSAGRILAQVIPRLIINELGKLDNGLLNTGSREV